MRTRFETDTMSLNEEKTRVPLALFVLRVSIFLVMAIWTIDKFVRPDHAASVYEHFYGLRGLGFTAMYAVAAAELLLLIGFVLGIAQRFTYGAVFLLHAISTFSAFHQYLHPFENKTNLLFFAAWPMLAACFALYYLRGLDTRWHL